MVQLKSTCVACARPQVQSPPSLPNETIETQATLLHGPVYVESPHLCRFSVGTGRCLVAAPLMLLAQAGAHKMLFFSMTGPCCTHLSGQSLPSPFIQRKPVPIYLPCQGRSAKGQENTSACQEVVIPGRSVPSCLVG